MLYNNTETKIIREIYLNKSIHKRQLSRNLRLSMPSIEYALKKLPKFIKKEKIGNQLHYSLEYSNPELSAVLGVVESGRLANLPPKIRLAVADLLAELDPKPLLALIFGSYSRGDFTNSSDLDILLIFQSITNPEQICHNISMRTNLQISPIYLDYEQFRKSFADSTKDFFKEIKRDKLLLVGIEWWRQLESKTA